MKTRQGRADVAESAGHHVEYCAGRTRRHLLFEARDTQIRLLFADDLVRLDLARHDTHERGFAGAVTPDQGDALAAVDTQFGVVEQRMGAVGQTQVAQLQNHGRDNIARWEIEAGIVRVGGRGRGPRPGQSKRSPARADSPHLRHPRPNGFLITEET